jgi:hypothetical protein
VQEIIFGGMSRDVFFLIKKTRENKELYFSRKKMKIKLFFDEPPRFVQTFMLFFLKFWIKYNIIESNSASRLLYSSDGGYDPDSDVEYEEFIIDNLSFKVSST